MIFHGAHFNANWFGRPDFDDEALVRDRLWNIRPGDVVLDVGAAVGSYTLPALACGATVIAMAPQNDQRRQLEENLALNPDFAERCIVLDVGAYDRDGWLLCNGSAYEFSDEQPINEPHPSETLRVRRIDELDFGVDRLDWIKMDVEGAEEKALRAAEQTIRRFRPRMLIENHVFMDPAIMEKVGFFVLGLDIGYTMTVHAHHSGTVNYSLFEVAT